MGKVKKHFSMFAGRGAPHFANSKPHSRKLRPPDRKLKVRTQTVRVS